MSPRTSSQQSATMIGELAIPPLPENTCTYDEYNPDTLEPLNETTYIRLRELGWTSEEFSGRTVLDIGCNSGLLTMYALKLGARSVFACDVQRPLYEFVSAISARKSLPVTTSPIGFDKLNPAEHKADVVLFMELLHWVVSQGIPLRQVIQRLALLTGETLYMEFPWSVEEPSIQKQTTLTDEDYSASAVLDELTRYFCDVRVVRFMHYFGFSAKSKRVLIRAKQKRAETELLVRYPQAYSLGVSLSRGRNESYLLNSPKGLLVAKVVGQESKIFNLDESLRNRLFDELQAIAPVRLVPPVKVGNTYCVESTAGQMFMVYRYVGSVISSGRPAAVSLDDVQSVALFAEVRGDLRKLSPSILEELRAARFFQDVNKYLLKGHIWSDRATSLRPLVQAVSRFLENVGPIDANSLDALCHGDLQTGNIIFDEHRQPKVVDLDNISLGTIYSDGLMGLIWRGASRAAMNQFCALVAPHEPRAVNRTDIAYALASGIGWVNEVCALGVNEQIRRDLDAFAKGAMEALRFAETL